MKNSFNMQCLLKKIQSNNKFCRKAEPHECRRFKREWTAEGDTLIPFTPESLQPIALPDASTDFLVNAGLPDSAAPFLDFHGHGTRRLQPASGAYPIGSEFKRFLCIGTNDSGDPICIDTESNGAVVSVVPR